MRWESVNDEQETNTSISLFFLPKFHVKDRKERNHCSTHNQKEINLSSFANEKVIFFEQLLLRIGNWHPDFESITYTTNNWEERK